jgi:phosphoribosylformylglycinamidine (FGAM) synthase-like amidotransferase family enzyme
MDQAEEIRQIVESASQGYWLPIGILAGAFSIIIALLLYIWNQMIKNNNARHESSEELLKTAMENQTSLRSLVTQHDVEIKHLKERIA